MLQQPIKEKLHALKLQGMVEALEYQEQDEATRGLSFLDRLALLIDQQWNWRQNQALTRRVIASRLRGPACVDVLVVDDWAMNPMSEAERRDFWEIAEDRYQARSMILTSQLPVSRWHEQIGDPTLADGILDRLVQNAHRIAERLDHTEGQVGAFLTRLNPSAEDSDF
jgi:hypothetical protein